MASKPSKTQMISSKSITEVAEPESGSAPRRKGDISMSWWTKSMAESDRWSCRSSDAHQEEMTHECNDRSSTDKSWMLCRNHGVRLQMRHRVSLRANQRHLSTNFSTPCIHSCKIAGRPKLPCGDRFKSMHVDRRRRRIIPHCSSLPFATMTTLPRICLARKSSLYSLHFRTFLPCCGFCI
jgi:hypothetical protein